MRFLYLRDPLFLTAFTLYWVNRWLLKPNSSAEFLRGHFNDLLCIPFFVPIVVLIARVGRMRGHDRPPSALEILLPLVVWSVLFELWFPRLPFWSRYVVGDPYDILWYCTGAFIASLWWRRFYKVRAASAPGLCKPPVGTGSRGAVP